MGEPKDEEEELIAVVDDEPDADKAPADKAPADKAPAEGAPALDDDDDDDDGADKGTDARLADDEDGELSDNQKRRRERRDRARVKREATERELAALRQQNRDLAARLGTVEGHALQANVQQVEARYNQVLVDIQEAETIYAKAVAEGQGEYAMQAMRIRDAAKDEAKRLADVHKQISTAATTPQVDPRVASHAQDWMAENKWYDPSGADPTSALTKRLDSALAAEGYDPASRLYWEELTKRVTQALKPAADPAPERRAAPPMGGSSEHAPMSTRRSEIRVTPERKAAMIEAGIWDDPVRRQRVLREYRDYDKATAR